MKESKRYVSILIVFASLLILYMPVAEAQNSLIAAYSFDEVNGSTVIDSSGNGHDGVIVGTEVSVNPNGGFGHGSVLDSNNPNLDTGSYVDLGQVGELNGLQHFTLSAWMKRRSSGQRVLIGRQNQATDGVTLELWSDGNMYFVIRDGSFAEAGVSLNDNQWHHYACTFDGTQSTNSDKVKCYIDGVQQSLFFSGTFPSAIASSSLPFYLTRVLSSGSNGFIDDLRIYNKTQTIAEIQADMSTSVGSVQDTTPPVISNITATNIVTINATITWSTDENSDSIVEYGTTTSYGINVTNSSLVTSHSVELSGLTSNTLYHYRVWSTDSSGNSAVSSDRNFTTLSLDAEPPGAPDNLSAVGNLGQIDLVWIAATDNIGVVEYNIHRLTVSGFTPNSSNLIAEVPRLSYVDSGIFGVYYYVVTAEDAVGNVGAASDEASAEATTDTTPPSVAITNLLNSSIVSEIITLTANANDDVAVSEVEFFIDGNSIGIDTTSPYSLVWNSRTVLNGSHVVNAQAKDSFGNIDADSIIVNVQNAPPFVNVNGVLRVSAANPRYFTDDTRNAVYLTGSHTWSNFVDNGLTDPPHVLNYTGYLDLLESNNHNLIRLWVGWEQAKWNTFTSQEYWFDPSPFERTGPGNALDGKPKFNLNSFNQAFFDRLRDRVIEAGERGMYISILLFNGWSLDSKGLSGNPWIGHPFNVNNNVNGINGDPNSDNTGVESHTLADPQITAVQEAYLRKVIDTVNDLDNVLYEITNEDTIGTNNTQWQYHIINYIKAYEANLSNQHPVGMSVQFPGGDNNVLLNSPADWISPGLGFFGDGDKVVMADTDHFFGAVEGDNSWLWQMFTRGTNVQYMDTYGSDDYAAVAHPNLDPNNPVTVNFRQNMGYTRLYADKMDLNNMVPSGSLFSSEYGLAKATLNDSEYLGYLNGAGSINIDLSSASGNLSVEWLNLATGQITNAASVQGGAVRTLNSPISGDSVVYLKRIVDTESPTAPGSLSAVDGLEQVSLTWEAATDDFGVVKYKIHRFVTSGFIPNASNLIAEVSVLSYIDLVSPGTYFYVVTAEDAAGNIGPVSNEANATAILIPNQPPSVPANLQATALSSAEIEVTWNSSVDDNLVVSYNIYRDGVPIGNVSATTFIDSGLVANTNYTYEVSAMDDDGAKSNRSNSTIGTTGAPPVLTIITITPNFVTLATGASLDFNAQGIDQYGNLIAALFNWSVKHNSSIDSNGNFTAGYQVITATSGSVSGSAIVVVS